MVYIDTFKKLCRFSHAPSSSSSSSSSHRRYVNPSVHKVFVVGSYNANQSEQTKSGKYPNHVQDDAVLNQKLLSAELVIVMLAADPISCVVMV